MVCYVCMFWNYVLISGKYSKRGHFFLQQSLSVSSSIRFSFCSICCKAFRSWWLVPLKKHLVRSSFSFSSPCWEKGARLPYCLRNSGMWLTSMCIYGVTCFVWKRDKNRSSHACTIFSKLSTSIILGLSGLHKKLYIDMKSIQSFCNFCDSGNRGNRSGILMCWKRRSFSGPVRSRHCNVFNSLLMCHLKLILHWWLRKCSYGAMFALLSLLNVCAFSVPSSFLSSSISRFVRTSLILKKRWSISGTMWSILHMLFIYPLQ